MWNPFAKKTGEVVTLKLNGMHCVSCALNIDGELEDTPGVISSKTIYAKSVSMVNYDPQKVSLETIKAVIERLGYRVA